MAIDVLVCQRSKVSVRAFCALVSFFVTGTSVPFVDTDRLIATFFSGLAKPSSCKDIFTTFEETAKQGNFFVKRELDGRKCDGRECRPVRNIPGRIYNGQTRI